MNDANWEKKCTSDQEPPSVIGKAIKNMVEPCEHANDSDDPPHSVSLLKLFNNLNDCLHVIGGVGAVYLGTVFVGIYPGGCIKVDVLAYAFGVGAM